MNTNRNLTTEKICLNKSLDAIFEKQLDHARILRLSGSEN